MIIPAAADRAVLTARATSARAQHRVVIRAKIILAAAAGQPNAVVAAELGLHVDTVRKWRKRYCEHQLDGLKDLPRSGRPAHFTAVQAAQVKALACTPPSDNDVPLARWSSAELAVEAVGQGLVTSISPATVRRWLAADAIKPWGLRPFSLVKSRLHDELARIDVLLDDPAVFAPFTPFSDPRLGRPSTPMETYLRLMFLKFRYRLGFESLCREVSDSIIWRQFCRDRDRSIGAAFDHADEADHSARVGRDRRTQRRSTGEGGGGEGAVHVAAQQGAAQLDGNARLRGRDRRRQGPPGQPPRLVRRAAPAHASHPGDHRRTRRAAQPSQQFARDLQDAGVETTHRYFEGVMHEFFGASAVLDKAEQAQQDAAQHFLRAFETAT